MIHPPTAILREESPRAATWRQVFGTNAIPIKSPLPVMANSPVGPRSFYQVDVEKLDEAVVERVIDHLAAEFGESREAVAEGIRGDHGLPILADDVSVSCDIRLLL